MNDAKTSCVLFNTDRNRSITPDRADVDKHLNIRLVTQTKFLGVTLDSGLK